MQRSAADHEASRHGRCCTADIAGAAGVAQQIMGPAGLAGTADVAQQNIVLAGIAGTAHQVMIAAVIAAQHSR